MQFKNNWLKNSWITSSKCLFGYGFGVLYQSDLHNLKSISNINS